MVSQRTLERWYTALSSERKRIHDLKLKGTDGDLKAIIIVSEALGWQYPKDRQNEEKLQKIVQKFLKCQEQIQKAINDAAAKAEEDDDLWIESCNRELAILANPTARLGLQIQNAIEGLERLGYILWPRTERRAQ